MFALQTFQEQFRTASHVLLGMELSGGRQVTAVFTEKCIEFVLNTCMPNLVGRNVEATKTSITARLLTLRRQSIAVLYHTGTGKERKTSEGPQGLHH